ncbi:hypothetical protein SSTU70S_05201 [Stutzerimonas stutzeri]
MVGGGPRFDWLEAVGARHPLSLHGVSLSLAADCAPDEAHLQRLKALAERVRPALMSEHLGLVELARPLPSRPVASFRAPRRR